MAEVGSYSQQERGDIVVSLQQREILLSSFFISAHNNNIIIHEAIKDLLSKGTYFCVHTNILWNKWTHFSSWTSSPATLNFFSSFLIFWKKWSDSYKYLIMHLVKCPIASQTMYFYWPNPSINCTPMHFLLRHATYSGCQQLCREHVEAQSIILLLCSHYYNIICIPLKRGLGHSWK